MQVQLKAWGNSQGIRFSREFLASAGIKPDPRDEPKGSEVW